MLLLKVKLHGGRFDDVDDNNDDAKVDPFWKQVGVVMKQLQGLERGYNQVVKQGKVPAIPHVGFLVRKLLLLLLLLF
jgi:hypothetical protein